MYFFEGSAQGLTPCAIGVLDKGIRSGLSFILVTKPKRAERPFSTSESDVL